MKLSALLFLFLLPATAAEYKLEAKPFRVRHHLKAVALPETAMPLKLNAKTWSAFEIVSLVDHGTKVRKGDVMVGFKRDGIEQKMADLKLAIASGELGLAQAEFDLSMMRHTAPEQLKRMEKQARVAAEELDHFLSTRRQAEIETADQSLKRQRQLLASYEEELKQLLKMYEADDLTEDTEEIILKKQRDNVEHMKFLLEMEILDHKRKISVSLPREEVALLEKRDDSALQFERAGQDLPRGVELKNIEVAKMKNTLDRQKTELAELEHDLAFFEIKAPADGWVYYGAVERGTWTTAEMSKLLTPNGVVPAGKVFASLVPAAAKLQLFGSATQSDASSLQAQAKGFAMLTGNPGVLIPVRVAQVSAVPGADGAYPTTFLPEWPESFMPVCGQSYEVTIISYEKEQALTVPANALELGSTGWVLEVKDADGKTGRRPVTRGRTFGEVTEITAGVNAGEVIVLP